MKGWESKEEDHMDQVPDGIAEMASLLVAADFSSDDGIKERVRRNYLRQCETQISRETIKEGFISSMINKQRPILAAGVLVIALLVGFTFYSPGSLMAAVNNATYTIVKVLKIGDYAQIVQMGDPSPQPAAIDKDTRIVKKGESISVSTVKYDSLDKVKKAAACPVLVPQYLPTGYSFSYAESYPGSDEYLNLYFKGSGKDIILMLRAMNEQTKYEFATDGAVEAVNIKGNKAAWVEPHTLIWDQDGINYSLFCSGQSKDEALKIAHSVK